MAGPEQSVATRNVAPNEILLIEAEPQNRGDMTVSFFKSLSPVDKTVLPAENASASVGRTSLSNPLSDDSDGEGIHGDDITRNGLAEESDGEDIPSDNRPKDTSRESGGKDTPGADYLREDPTGKRVDEDIPGKNSSRESTAEQSAAENIPGDRVPAPSHATSSRLRIPKRRISEAFKEKEKEAPPPSKRKVKQQAQTQQKTIRNIVPIITRSDSMQKSESKLSKIFDTFARLEASASPGTDPVLIHRLRSQTDDLRFYHPRSKQNAFYKTIMDKDKGLNQLIDSTVVPQFIRHDLWMICQKWKANNLDPHLLRGIVVFRRDKVISASSRTSRCLQPNYVFRKSAHVIGDNGLANGAWWPWQMCAVRDGAHGDPEGGISGSVGMGATSIVLSAGSGRNATYNDLDQGDIITYSGTKGKDGMPSSKTNLLLESTKKQTPIRVLRSSKLNSEFHPRLGLRYDGLYVIEDSWLRDHDHAMYSFKLRRCPGQYQIRSAASGEAERPTSRELAEWDRVQKTIARRQPEKE